MKKNCWEYKACGRGPDGDKAGTLGICPAASEVRLNGVHEGMNAGRSCWVVIGTDCNGLGHLNADAEFKTCADCDFYKTVKQEEKSKFLFSGTLLTNWLT